MASTPPSNSTIRRLAPDDEDALFEGRGFERYGLEPRARRFGDTYVDQAYLIRSL